MWVHNMVLFLFTLTLSLSDIGNMQHIIFQNVKLLFFFSALLESCKQLIRERARSCW
jgi:hypothetical protein